MWKSRSGSNKIWNALFASVATPLCLVQLKNLILKLFQVTWIRQRDVHVLTVGLFTYTTDGRFTALHSERSTNWTLRIDFAQKSDSGSYECQISTEPKISKAFMLHVVGKWRTGKVALVSHSLLFSGVFRHVCANSDINTKREFFRYEIVLKPKWLNLGPKNQTQTTAVMRLISIPDP